MIRTDFYETREDGVRLYRTDSDAKMMIRKDDTGELYDDAVDVENSGNTYTETDIPIVDDADTLTVADTLALLGELGVDTNDQQA